MFVISSLFSTFQFIEDHFEDYLSKIIYRRNQCDRKVRQLIHWYQYIFLTVCHLFVTRKSNPPTISLHLHLLHHFNVQNRYLESYKYPPHILTYYDTLYTTVRRNEMQLRRGNHVKGTCRVLDERTNSFAVKTLEEKLGATSGNFANS